MIDDKQAAEVWGLQPVVAVRTLLQDRKERIAALTALEADNAALLKAVKEFILHMEGYRAFTLPLDLVSLLARLEKVRDSPHPGAALLVRHAKELAAKDAEIAQQSKLVIDQHQTYLEASRRMEAELARAREALRDQCLGIGDAGGTIKGDVQMNCCVCGGEWWHNKKLNVNPESHNPVTIMVNGVETTGPCPARPKEGK